MKSHYITFLVHIFILFESIVSDMRIDNRDNWNGKWFPVDPRQPKLFDKSSTENAYEGRIAMGVLDSECDDVKTNLFRDFDPRNLSHHEAFLCTANRSEYKSSLTILPSIQEYTIPREYSALHRCMNESIEYDDNIPTFGTHRPNWPVYGEYEYVPVQRWLHSLEHGSIVALYHPCADKNQINILRKLIKSCLYRHVITPYKKLTTERPFALVAWGKSMEMSYIDSKITIGFIRMNALQGPEKTSRDGKYSESLVEKASIVSDQDDSSLCPNM